MRCDYIVNIVRLCVQGKIIIIMGPYVANLHLLYMFHYCMQWVSRACVCAESLHFSAFHCSSKNAKYATNSQCIFAKRVENT